MDEAAGARSLTFRDSNSSLMASHSAIYLLDIDYDTASTKQRGIYYLVDNSLRHGGYLSSFIGIALTENNDRRGR